MSKANKANKALFSIFIFLGAALNVWPLTQEYMRAEQTFDNPGAAPKISVMPAEAGIQTPSPRKRGTRITGMTQKAKAKPPQKRKDSYDCPDWTKPGYSGDLGLPNLLPLIGAGSLILGVGFGALATWAWVAKATVPGIFLSLMSGMWLTIAAVAYYHNYKINQCLHRGHNHSSSRSNSRNSQPNLNEPRNNWP